MPDGRPGRVLGRINELVAAMVAADDAAGLAALCRRYERVVEDAGAELPYPWLVHARLAQEYQRCHRLSGDVAPLTTSIAWSTRALGETPDDEPQRAAMLGSHAASYLYLYTARGDPADLDAAIRWGEAGLELTPVNARDRSEREANLFHAYAWRYHATRDLGNMEGMRRYGPAALVVAGDDPRSDEIALQVAWSGLGRHMQTGRRDYLDEAARVLVPALSTRGAAIDPGQLAFRVAWAYHNVAVDSGARPDIETAMEWARRAADANPDGSRERWEAVGLLMADAHQWRFDATGELDELRAAVRNLVAAVEALPEGDEQRTGLLGTLTRSYLDLYHQEGDESLLRAAIEAGEAAVAGDAPLHRVAAVNLAMAYGARYERTGDLDDLTAAIDLDAALVPAEGGRHGVPALNNLIVSYTRRFLRTGDVDDLDRAIDAGEAAAEVLGGHDANTSTCLANLSVAYRLRFVHTGDGTDLAAAAARADDAVRVLPEGHRQTASRLMTAASAHSAVFRRTGDPADGELAIEFGRRAVALGAARHDDLGLAEANLCGQHLERHAITGDAADLSAAMELAERAVALIDDRHHRWSPHNEVLAAAYLRRYRTYADRADLDAAARHAEVARSALPAGHSAVAGVVANLAVIRFDQFEAGTLSPFRLLQLNDELAGLDAASPADQLAACHNVAVLVQRGVRWSRRHGPSGPRSRRCRSACPARSPGRIRNAG